MAKGVLFQPWLSVANCAFCQMVLNLSQHENGRDWDEETYDVKVKVEGRFGRSWSLSRTQWKEGSTCGNNTCGIKTQRLE